MVWLILSMVLLRVFSLVFNLSLSLGLLSLPQLSIHKAPIDNMLDTCGDSLSGSVTGGFQSRSLHFLRLHELLNLVSFDIQAG